MASKKELLREIEFLKEDIRSKDREIDNYDNELRDYRHAAYEENRTKKRETQINAIIDYRKKFVEGGFNSEEAVELISLLIERGCLVY